MNRRRRDIQPYDPTAAYESFERRGADPTRGDGHLPDVLVAQAARHAEDRHRWAAEDRRRERRAGVIAACVTMWPLFLGVALALGVLGLMVAWWLMAHLLEVALAVGVVGVGAGSAWWAVHASRTPAEKTVVVAASATAAPPIAPADRIRRLPTDTAVWQDMGAGLPSVEARAIHNALPASRAAKYREVVQANMLPAPRVVQADGKRVVEAMMPSGLATPEDVDVRRLAAGLGVEDHAMVSLVGCTPTMLRVEVLDAAPGSIPAGDWPLLTASGPFSYSDPTPVGTDGAGKTVEVAAIEPELGARHLLFAGDTGCGKTWAARMLLLAAAADPRVELHICVMKPSRTLRLLKDRAAFYHEDIDGAAGVVEHLRGVLATVGRRGHANEDAETHGAIVVAIDEPQQQLWSVKGAEEVVTSLCRLGREAGVQVLLATQTPTKASVPPVILGQCTVRLAGQLQNPELTRRMFGDGCRLVSRVINSLTVWDDGICRHLCWRSAKRTVRP